MPPFGAPVVIISTIASSSLPLVPEKDAAYRIDPGEDRRGAGDPEAQRQRGDQGKRGAARETRSPNRTS